MKTGDKFVMILIGMLGAIVVVALLGVAVHELYRRFFTERKPHVHAEKSWCHEYCCPFCASRSVEREPVEKVKEVKG